MLPLAKNIKRYFSFKEFAVVFLAIVISVSAGIGVFLYMKKEVVISDNGKHTVVRTMKSTVGEVLDQNGIKVTPEDYINLPLGTKLHKISKTDIYIKRAVPVNILVDGKKTRVMTYRDTVKEVLADNPVAMSGTDRLEGLTLYDKVTGNMTIRIVRVKEEFQSEKIPLPYMVVRKENNNLDKGTERVVKVGKEGIREKTFKVVFEDGMEVARALLSDNNILNPVSKLIEFGTVMNFKTSRGETVRYDKVLSMRATAYTASFADTGKHPDNPAFGITYTGMRAKKGVIAVDPKVIPLGTRVYIEGVGSTPDYGFAIAADVGSAIKNDLIDLYFEDGKTVSNWGCKKVKVYIIH